VLGVILTGILIRNYCMVAKEDDQEDRRNDPNYAFADNTDESGDEAVPGINVDKQTVEKRKVQSKFAKRYSR